MVVKRTIAIWMLLICGAALVADAKPFFVKVFAAPSAVYTTTYTTATAAPVNTQVYSNFLAQKINLFNSFLMAKTAAINSFVTAKTSGGTFGFTKTWSYPGTTAATTTTTESPISPYISEVTTDFIPDYSSSTQSVYSTTTDDYSTPKPSVHPPKPITTTTAVIPVESSTKILPTAAPIIPTESSTEAYDTTTHSIPTRSTTESSETPTSSEGYSYDLPNSIF